MNTSTTPDLAEALLSEVDQYVQALGELPANKRLSAPTLDLVYKLALQQLGFGHVKTARDYLSLLLVYAPTDARFLEALAQCCEQEGDSDEALRHYSLALYISPTSNRLALAVAENLARRGEEASAISILQDVVRLANKPSELKYRLRAEVWLQRLKEGAVATT